MLELWKGVELLSLLVNVPTNLATWPLPPVNFLAARGLAWPPCGPETSQPKVFLGFLVFWFCWFVVFPLLTQKAV